MKDLDKVFDQSEDKNIDAVKRVIKRYEEDMKKHSATVMNQKRAKVEKEKTKSCIQPPRCGATPCAST